MLLLGSGGLASLAAQQPPVDWAAVDRALGKTGTMMAGDVHRVGFPRSDLHVTIGAVVLKPTFALGSWVAFKQTGDNEAMVMGDLVLLESEINAVASKLETSGVRPTALHNHLLREMPHVMYMHIGGRGNPVALATAIHDALALTATPFNAPPAAPIDLDTAQVAQILGYHGSVAGGVYQVGVPRAEPIVHDGMEIPPSMGLATALNFQPTGASTAAITGDFVMVQSEVSAVQDALRANGIEITALHHHLIGESPRLYFMHFWANDSTVKLARGLRAALDKMNVKR